MHILLANKYFFIRGGAETSFFETGNLLREKGHCVSYFSMQDERNVPTAYAPYFVSHVDYDTPGWRHKAKAAGRPLYSFEARRKLKRLIIQERPDVAHLTNIYHQISPSILHTLKEHGIPTVMTLQDYKIVCASYAMLTKNGICEACQNGRYYQAFLKGCVKDSKAKSLLNTLEMYLHHKVLKLYDLVDVFIAPSAFLKEKVEEMGFRGPVVYLPNFTSFTNESVDFTWEQPIAVSFGQLSKEKGLSTLIDAARQVSGLTLNILGEGPCKEELETKVRREGITNVHFLGYRQGDGLKAEIKRAMFLVIPSEWYENSPLTVIEGFALGKPAIGSRIGGIPELVRDGQTGWTYRMGDVGELKAKLQWMVDHPDEVRAMAQNARMFIVNELDKETHYHKLLSIYESAMRHANKI